VLNQIQLPKLIAGLLLMLMLVACGSENKSDESSSVESSTTSEQAATTDSSTPSDTTTSSETKTDSKEMTTETNSSPSVVLKTSMGDIVLELDAEKAPLTVANFLDYVKDGHYNGTIFHRVITGFMIQGGGFEPGMNQKPTKAPIANEANNGLPNDEFTISMARTSDPHSATAQFFINVNNNEALNFRSETGQGWGYAVFGKVTSGQDVVKAIEIVHTGRSGPHGDVPLVDVVIESAEIK
jgi:peptidyl-prolyl cis-trans isomerase B (cyclophilin B)